MKLAVTRWQIAAAAVAVVVVVAGKQFYRDASAGELRVFLAPTAHLVSAVTGSHFTYEAGTGWIDRDVTFIISPACAGVNFALAAFLALVLGGLVAMRGARDVVVRLVACGAVAYVATIVVNTVRVAIAIGLHQSDLGSLDRGEVHRMEGIVVYLGGLCVLYALATRRRAHA